jgi:hypothetical protein
MDVSLASSHIFTDKVSSTFLFVGINSPLLMLCEDRSAGVLFPTEGYPGYFCRGAPRLFFFLFKIFLHCIHCCYLFAVIQQRDRSSFFSLETPMEINEASSSLKLAAHDFFPHYHISESYSCIMLVISHLSAVHYN